MGYGFKYSTSDIDNTLRKGNATTTAGHAANPSNNFHSGIAVVSGKHTVAKVFSSGDPDYWSLNDEDLVRLINSLGGDVENSLEAINYILNQSDLFYIDNSVYDSSVLDDVAVNLQGDYDSSFVDNKPTTNLLPNADKNGRFTTENQWASYNTNQYNSNTYFSIGTVSGVSDNIVTLSSVGRTIRSFDVLRAQTSGGGVTAGTNYVIKKITSTTFSLHEYNSSQNGSQGYTNPTTDFFKVHDAYALDIRIPINATSFPTMWWGAPHLPNSGMIKEIVPNGGYAPNTNCMRFHVYRGDGVADGMAYNVYTPVTQGDVIIVSYWARPTDSNGYGKSLTYSTYFGAGQSAPGFSTVMNSDGEWQLVTHTWTASTTVSFYSYFFPAGSTAIYAIDIADMQVEINQPQATPFVVGTRSQNTNWVDLSGNSNDASLTNAPIFEKESKALNFDGEDQYATIDSNSAFTVNTRTVEMTFKMNGTYANFAPLATYANGSSTSNRIWLGLQNSKWQMHGWGTTDPNATTTIIADGWYTCVFSYNGNAVQQMKLYTNGKLESTTTNTQGGVVGANGNNWYLATIPGGWQSQTYSAMSINSFKIYSRILTDDEVESNFFGGPILTDNLVFNADAGNLTSYESGSSTAYSTQDAIDGTLNNGVDFSFENGGSWVFDGTDDFINFGSDSPIDFIYSDPFSLEVWFNPDNLSGFKHLIGKSYVDYRLAQSNAGISFRLDSNNLTTQLGTLVAGEWTHIVATWEPSTSTAYVYQDGVLKGSVTDTTVDWTSTGNNFQLGTSPGEAYYVQGKIPIGRAYSKTLSLEEVQKNYIALKPRFPS